MRARLLLLLAALGCTGPRLALPAELTVPGARELPVTDERRSAGPLLSGRSAGVLRFGGYAADWEREPTEVHAPAPGPGGTCWTRDAVRFVLRTPGQAPRSAHCEARMEGSYQVNVRGQGVSVADDAVTHRVHCRLPGGGTLQLGDAGAERGWLRGEAQVDGVRLVLEPAAPPGSGWLRPAGFVLREGSGAVAAVQRGHSPAARTVWLAPALSGATRSAALLTAAALLLTGSAERSCADVAR